jgi:hypothetical protein
MRDTWVGAGEFAALFDVLCNWGSWGEQDERGALHHVTPERVKAATRPVRDGVSVSLSLPLDTEPAAHNPVPADHHMTLLGERNPTTEPVHFIKDYIGADYPTTGTPTSTRCAMSPTRAGSTTTGPSARLPPMARLSTRSQRSRTASSDAAYC